MKNVFFILAFMLIGSFTFASNNVVNIDVANDTNTTITENVIDLQTFVKQFDVNEIDFSKIQYDVESGSFPWTDSCGNEWIVEYEGMSFLDAVNTVFLLDDLLCAIA